MIVLTVIALVYRVFALSPSLTAAPQKLTPDFVGLSIIALPVVAVLVAVFSQLCFATFWARVGATFFGLLAVLYVLALPELAVVVNMSSALCAEKVAAGETVPMACEAPVRSLVEVLALWLFAWSVGIVVPIVAAVTFVHAWVLLLGAVVHGFIQRLHRARAG
ncbi:hypothetical protein AUC68_05125 [Methyloceanibacter methanicus]|uniref:Uncharacterized protein n=1 Tax=Methyloceanibacter methanicus TaxID=1774968 RepID=A0A1E3W2J2_9HYPH|nr:hypothetical protein [Methyloceanibacter methanicus]ODR99356.1 hypothetical protein AUC68_05125 [Methyloceanibacter methanicus]